MSTKYTLSQLHEACSANDLERVKKLVETWLRTTHRPTTRGIDLLEPPVCIAASRNYATIVSFFLDRKMSISRTIAKAAVEEEATDVLEVLFDHGWDINSTVGLGAYPWLARSLVYSLSLCFLLHTNTMIL